MGLFGDEIVCICCIGLVRIFAHEIALITLKRTENAIAIIRIFCRFTLITEVTSCERFL